MTSSGGCPGSRMQEFNNKSDEVYSGDKAPSRLKQWPIQLHLVSPIAPYYRESDVVLAADCVAYAIGSFHEDHLKGKSLAIACPKLDENQEVYSQKIQSLIEDSEIKSLTVMIMQVPCCTALLNLAQEAAEKASRKIPIKVIIVGLQGEILLEQLANEE